MTRSWHIAVKDIVVWVRDPAAMGVLLLMPAVLIFILGSALGGMGGDGTSGIDVAIVDLSRGGAVPVGSDKPPSDELVEVLSGAERLTGLFDVVMLPTERSARSAIRQGDFAAALVIPRHFDDDVASGRDATLVVLKDPGSALGADIWESVITAYASTFSAASVSVQSALAAVAQGNPAAAGAPGTTGRITGEAVAAVTDDEADGRVEVVDDELTGVVQVTALDYYGLSMISMFLMFGAMFGAFSTIQENREQTMSRLMSSPTPRYQIVAGKTLSVFLLGMSQFAVLYVVTRFMFGVEWGRDPVATVAVAAAEMFAVTGLATLIASFARTERAAGGIGPLVVQIQALIGGAFFTIAILPEWVQPVRYLSVVGWTMEAWTAVQIRGAGVGDVLGPIGALVGIGVVLFGVGVWRTEALK